MFVVRDTGGRGFVVKKTGRGGLSSMTQAVNVLERSLAANPRKSTSFLWRSRRAICEI